MFHPSFVVPVLDIHGEQGSFSRSFLIIRVDGHLLCGDSGIIHQSIPKEISGHVSSRFYLGILNTQAWWAVGIGESTPLLPGYSLKNLRDTGEEPGSPLSGIACRAVQLVRFDTLTRFCGYCGSQTVLKADEIAKVCTSCKRIIFPRLSPAVIVRITDGDRILLSRSPHFPEGMYSVQAGFVEPGESLEATVIREVREEVGIEIANLTYFGSQPWPFPDSLMIGFTAEYTSGELTIDHREIEDAQWVDRSHLPKLPGHDSIARALIEDWLAG